MRCFVPKGPKGERRPADVIGSAVKMMKIATGEEEPDAHGQELSRPGRGGFLPFRARGRALLP